MYKIHTFILTISYDNSVVNIEKTRLAKSWKDYSRVIRFQYTDSGNFSRSCYVGIQTHSYFFQQLPMGCRCLPVFWPAPESALPDQVTETKEAVRRTLPPFATGRRSRALRLCCSGGKSTNQIFSDDQIYFRGIITNLLYLTTKILRMTSLRRSLVQQCVVLSVEISSLRVGS